MKWSEQLKPDTDSVCSPCYLCVCVCVCVCKFNPWILVVVVVLIRWMLRRDCYLHKQPCVCIEILFAFYREFFFVHLLISGGCWYIFTAEVHIHFGLYKCNNYCAQFFQATQPHTQQYYRLIKDIFCLWTKQRCVIKNLLLLIGL